MCSDPASGTIKPAAMLRSVVLPEPLGPSSVTNSPAATSSDSGCSAGTSPKDLATPRKLSERGSADTAAVLMGHAAAAFTATNSRRVIRIRIVEATAVTGVNSTRIVSHSFTGSVFACTPARKIDTTTSSNEVMKAKAAPPARPGTMSGSVTVRNTRHGDAPSPSAARTQFGSTPRSEMPTFTTTKGTASSVWPSARPRVVPCSPSGRIT